jgi:UDP-N-acetylglucosamine 2-epimerase (non-hydrolysing)
MSVLIKTDRWNQGKRNYKKMKILFVFGTRPEAIKLAPLIEEFQKFKKKFLVKVCITAQHREMLDQVMTFFNIHADYDLNLMSSDQSLSDIAGSCLKKLSNVMMDFTPDLIIVQGDTLSAFIGALVGYFGKIKIAHIEAGLRSGNKYSPFPEEINRILTGHIADFHFAPTEQARKNLLKEGIKKNVVVVGNTVIDALLKGISIVNEKDQKKFENYFSNIDLTSKIILVTAHRRESFGKPFENICNAIKEIAHKNPEVNIVFPVHMNPNVRKPVNEILYRLPNVHLLEPLDYPHLIWLMNKSYLILTDSGGIQEEAPSLNKPVLVLRDRTERMEGIKSNTAKLVGTSKKKIVDTTEKLLKDVSLYLLMSKSTNPYGDGQTSKRIVQYFVDKL